ncbi:MAG: histidine kinase [Eggerthellaceae bacterium]|nr:histidine kinase [Eggerthellaceae bacterium]
MSFAHVHDKCHKPNVNLSPGRQPHAKLSYNEHMERMVDKGIIFLVCGAVLFIIPQTTAFIVALLLALTVSALQEISSVPKPLRAAGLFAYLVASLVFPVLTTFVPLIAYDCCRAKNWLLRLCWVMPLLGALREYDFPVLLFLAVACLISTVLFWRTTQVEKERLNYTKLRDELRELSLTLEQKNRDLQEKQGFEVQLATLAERGRIAREIHDNVGHLLTRSVLQIEAAQVVHAGDEALTRELGQISTTLHEAFDTVRASVHDLHDDAFDPYAQLYAIAQESLLSVRLEYQAEEIPEAVGHGFVAIVKEALANTAKHSDATQARVSVTEYPAFWQLVVHDDGGTNPFNDKIERGNRFGVSGSRQGDQNSGGIGLATMEERVRSLGGIFRTDYDKGFRVFVSVHKEQV